MTMSEPSRGPAGTRDDEGDLTRSRARLSRETGCSESEAGCALGLSLERFRGARIRQFVTLLAERDARRRLRTLQLNAVKSIEPQLGAARNARRTRTQNGRDHAAPVQAVKDDRVPPDSDLRGNSLQEQA
jgi:hypothetical protein